MKVKSIIAILLCSAGLLVGCTSSEEKPLEVSIQDKFDDVIPSLCLENIGPDVDEVLAVIDAELKDSNAVTPYAVYGTEYGGESQVVVFDLLDSNNLLMHVTVKNSAKEGCIVSYTYDTPEEAKEQITSLLQKMLGDSVDVRIENEYYDYVVAYAQGKEYRWKDGHLERVP